MCFRGKQDTEMKELLETASAAAYLVFIALVFIVSAFSFYLFYFADCGLVKSWWILTQVPGRCL